MYNYSIFGEFEEEIDKNEKEISQEVDSIILGNGIEARFIRLDDLSGGLK